MPTSPDPLGSLSDRDHLVVCRALKALPSGIGADGIDAVVALLASTIPAVERTALQTIGRLDGARSRALGPVLGRLARRIEDGKGCDFECCGFSAYYAPVHLYVQALSTLADGPTLEEALQANEHRLDTAAIEEIRFLIDQWRAE